MNLIKEILYGKQPPDPIQISRNLFSTITSSSSLRDLMRGVTPNTHADEKLHVTALLAGHLLLMRYTSDSFAHFATQFEYSILFNSISDETKRQLDLYKYPLISPVIAFPNPAIREAIVPLFEGASETHSDSRTISAARLFAMMLSIYCGPFLQMFPNSGIHKVAISIFTVPKISSVLSRFILFAVSETNDPPPAVIRDEISKLASFIVGAVDATVKASPLR